MLAAAAPPLSPCSACGVSGALHCRNSNDHAVRCVVAAVYDMGGRLSLALLAGFAGVAVFPSVVCNVSVLVLCVQGRALMH
jgi:hypothetical protein